MSNMSDQIVLAQASKHINEAFDLVSLAFYDTDLCKHLQDCQANVADQMSIVRRAVEEERKEKAEC